MASLCSINKTGIHFFYIFCMAVMTAQRMHVSRLHVDPLLGGELMMWLDDDMDTLHV